MAKRSTVLKVAGMSKSFGPVVIVENFNLEVREGEAIALTGRNGAGKSTILRCIVGAAGMAARRAGAGRLPRGGVGRVRHAAAHGYFFPAFYIIGGFRLPSQSGF